MKYLKTNEVLRYYQEYFPSKKVRFITATEDTIDTYYKEDDDFIPFKAVMSEQYPKETSRKIKAVKIAKAKQGYIGTMVGAKTVKPSFRRKERIINNKENQIIVEHTHDETI